MKFKTPDSLMSNFENILETDQGNNLQWPSLVDAKAVRYWSCPLSRSRGRIIPHRPCMPKWAQTCEKKLVLGRARTHDLKIEG